MSQVIAYGNQKGGCGKTSTVCITAHYLVKKGFRVLVADLDHQGNATFWLAQQSPYNFTGKSMFEALQDRDVRPYIYQINDWLHIIPAEDTLEQFTKDIFSFREALNQVRHQYDFILLDLPPSTGFITQNALVAADSVVVLLQSDPLCYEALGRFLKLIDKIKSGYNDRLALAGILPTLVTPRASADRQIINQVREAYDVEGDEWVFRTEIKRAVRIKEFSINGISERTTEDRMALRSYKSYVEELLNRVSQA